MLNDLSPEAMAKSVVDNLHAVFVGLMPRLPEGERFTVDGGLGHAGFSIEPRGCKR